MLDHRVSGDAGVGIVAGVVDRGCVRFYRSGASGTSRTLDAHTLFEIGSVTKTFTATILSTMVLDGSVKLDDPVSKYLPALVHVPTRDGKQITLLELATQHSGLPRMPTNMDPGGPDPYAHYSIHDLYSFLDSYKLTRDPGQSFEYSNLGVALLGDALANRAHMSYGRLLQTRILDPLGMTETAMTLTPTERARFAAGHDADNNSVPPWNFESIAPAGAIRSTAADMVRYVRCNMGQGPLAKACLFAQQPRSKFPGNRIGLVWWTGDVVPIIHHGGDTAGYHASVAIASDHLRGVVVLTNGGAPVDDVAVHIVDPLLPVAADTAAPSPAATPAPAPSMVESENLDDYTGTYDSGQGLSFIVTRSGTQLMVQLTGQPAVPVYESATDKFYYKVVDAQIEFVRGADGKVAKLVLHQGGSSITAARPGVALPQPSFPPVVTLNSATLESYVGTYVASPGAAFTVTRTGDQILIQLTGQAAIPVYPSAKDSFYYKVVDAQVTFVRDANGKITQLILHQNGRDIPAVRS